MWAGKVEGKAWGGDASEEQKQELAAAQHEWGGPGKKSGSEPARHTVPHQERRNTGTKRKWFTDLICCPLI